MENCLSLAKSSEFDVNQCTQKKNKVQLTSTENGRKKIIDAVAIRKDKYINDFKIVTLAEFLSTASPIPASKTIRWRRH